MAIPDARTHAYLTAFRQEGSGGMAVFRGLQRYQYGRGFGSIFGGLLRHLIPVLLNVGKSALESFTQSRSHGSSIKDALRQTIKPIAESALSSAAGEVTKSQTGTGKKRKHKGKRKSHKSKKGRTQPSIAYNF